MTDLLRPSGYCVNTVLKLLLVLNWPKYQFCPPQRLCWCLDCYSPWRPWHLSCLAPLPRDPAVYPLGWGWCPVWCRKSCLMSVSPTWWTTGWRAPFCQSRQLQTPSCLPHLLTLPGEDVRAATISLLFIHFVTCSFCYLFIIQARMSSIC